MYVIEADCVDEALYKGLKLIKEHGVQEQSRAGLVWVMPGPVTTVYSHPQRRVLFNPKRDANPFFHLMEALWLLAGRNDAIWLDRYVRDFSARFAQLDGTMHGSYGFRWRRHFGGGAEFLPDQLDTVVRLLRTNPGDRQAVLAMWDPVADLGHVGLKDRPCNTHAYLRCRRGPVDNTGDYTDYVLDLTVCCRSNDLLWGAYGANAVHFSILQEYLAARIGVGIGKYYQVSNNYHLYDDYADWSILDSYAGTPKFVSLPIVTHPEAFDAELQEFMSGVHPVGAKNVFFDHVVVPMYLANHCWKQGSRVQAMQQLEGMPHCDWRAAAEQWCERRMAKAAGMVKP